MRAGLVTKLTQIDLHIFNLGSQQRPTNLLNLVAKRLNNTLWQSGINYRQ
jgi:hypothetical protein